MHTMTSAPDLPAKVARRLGSLARRLRGRHAGDASPGTRTGPSTATTATRPAGPAPDVEDQRTHYGPAMDAIVNRARRNQAPLGQDDDYELLRARFDHHHFMLQAERLQAAGDVDPIRRFLDAGPSMPHSPDPHFSASAYLARHPERGRGSGRGKGTHPYLAWLREGRAAGEVADPALGVDAIAEVAGVPTPELVEEVVRLREDMTQRLRHGTLGEMFAKAAEVEPLIAAAWSETARTRQLPVHGRYVGGQVAAIHACHEEAGHRRARVLVVAESPALADPLRDLGDVVRTLAGRLDPADVVVLYTGKGGRAGAGVLPPGVREVDFASRVEGFPTEHAELALVTLLRSFHAESLVNLESGRLYGALASYGKALAASERLVLWFPSHQEMPQGHLRGWALHWFYDGLDLVDGFVADSRRLRDELVEMYQLPESEAARIGVLPTVADPSIAPRPEPQPDRRPVVHWAGPATPQRRVDLVAELARRMPDVDFLVWDDALRPHLLGGPAPRNLSAAGPWPGFRDAEVGEADAWLHTSSRDGVPTALREAAMAQVPVVAGLVGGVGELLGDDDAELVRDTGDVAAYEEALRRVLADPAAAHRRAVRLRERLLESCPPAAVADWAEALLLEAGPTGGEAS